MTRISWPMPRFSSSPAAASIVSMSLSEPITIPTSGGSSPVCSATTASCGSAVIGRRSTARAPMSRRSWRPSNSIISAAAYAAARAAAGSAPERRDVQHAPAGGDELAVASRGPGVGHLDVGAGRARGRVITSPLELDSG